MRCLARSLRSRSKGFGDEAGQVAVLAGLMLFVFIGLGTVIIGAGNWFTHAKHLQTKADAAALAGGGMWAFPCSTGISQRIEEEARRYFGPHMKADGTPYPPSPSGTAYNPQVGGVGQSQVHAVLNGPPDGYYDDDSNPSPLEPDLDAAGAGICEGMVLDVKGTEDNSFPLFSLMPVFPDLKRKARVEIREVASQTGLLPIAMRAPVPLPAAVFYNEATGAILGVKYFIRSGSILGLPPTVQGWTTHNPEDSSPWARFNPPGRAGVVIAISFRGACNTNLPTPNNNIPVQPSGACFEDEFSTVSQLCNQGTIQVVNCYYATGSHPSETVRAGLHFIRGYADLDPGTSGVPSLESVHIETVSCAAAYFNWQRTPSTGGDCTARLHASVDVGNLIGDYGPPGPAGNEPLKSQDIEVRFKLVRPGSGAGASQCDFGVNCDLLASPTASAPFLNYQTQGGGTSPHLVLRNNSAQNSVAIRIRIKNAVNAANPACRGGGYDNNCRYFFTGDGLWTGTPEVPPDSVILARPVQRSFRGNSINASSVQWLRLTTDHNCDNSADAIDTDAASVVSDGCAGFYMEMGLKGGIALDADEAPILFTDGVASSKTGILHCDPAVSNGQTPIDSIANGCAPWYAPHSFDPVKYATSGLCPPANQIFQTPNPGAPWDDWPPLTCVKTRSTSSNQQMERGLKLRLFGNENTTSNPSGCPADAPGFVRGRNYWDPDTNPANNRLYGYRDDSPARDPFFNASDPRLVTIYLVPTYAITTDGVEKTYPIAGFVQVYITGFGDLQNGGALRPGTTDPCPGNTPPPISERDCDGDDCGFVAWGHVLNWVIPGRGTTPSDELCAPSETVQPCRPVLVE